MISSFNFAHGLSKISKDGHVIEKGASHLRRPFTYQKLRQKPYSSSIVPGGFDVRS